MKGKGKDQLNPSWSNLTVLDLIIDDFVWKEWNITDPAKIKELEFKMNQVISERNQMYADLITMDGN